MDCLAKRTTTQPGTAINYRHIKPAMPTTMNDPNICWLFLWQAHRLRANRLIWTAVDPSSQSNTQAKNFDLTAALHDHFEPPWESTLSLTIRLQQSDTHVARQRTHQKNVSCSNPQKSRSTIEVALFKSRVFTVFHKLHFHSNKKTDAQNGSKRNPLIRLFKLRFADVRRPQES